VNDYGLGQAYVRDALLNHPPAMSLWAAAVDRIAGNSAIDFARLFKLPSLIAELGTTLLLFFVWRARGDAVRGYAAAAIYAAALGNVLISSFHGNTDAIYFFFSFAAAYLIQVHQRAFLAGAMLALALNVKLIPILIVLPLAACFRDLRALLRYGAGLSLAVLSFGVALLTFAPDEQAHFVQNVFGYKSYPEFWGVELLARTLRAATWRALPELATTLEGVRDAYFAVGGKLLVLLTGVFALWLRFIAPPKANAYAVVGVAFSMFLLFSPGWGVQYFGCLLAPFLAVRLRSGLAVALATGAMATLIYLHFVNRWSPISSEHMPFPADFAGLSAMVWIVIAVHALKLLVCAWPVAAHITAAGETAPSCSLLPASENAPGSVPSMSARASEGET
jgi:hypothetical protein